MSVGIAQNSFTNNQLRYAMQLLSQGQADNNTLIYNGNQYQVNFPGIIAPGGGLAYNGNGLYITSLPPGIITAGNGISVSGSTVSVNEGNGLTFSGGKLVPNLGSGLEISGSSIIANLASNGALGFNTLGQIGVNTTTPIRIIGDSLTLTTGNYLFAPGGTLALLLSANGGLGGGTIGGLEVNTGNGLTHSGNNVVATLGPGMAFSGGAIVPSLATAGAIGINGSGLMGVNVSTPLAVGASVSDSIGLLVGPGLTVGAGGFLTATAQNVNGTAPIVVTGGSGIQLAYGTGLSVVGGTLTATGTSLGTIAPIFISGGDIGIAVGAGLSTTGGTLTATGTTITATAPLEVSGGNFSLVLGTASALNVTGTSLAVQVHGDGPVIVNGTGNGSLDLLLDSNTMGLTGGTQGALYAKIPSLYADAPMRIDRTIFDAPRVDLNYSSIWFTLYGAGTQTLTFRPEMIGTYGPVTNTLGTLGIALNTLGALGINTNTLTVRPDGTTVKINVSTNELYSTGAAVTGNNPIDVTGGIVSLGLSNYGALNLDFAHGTSLAVQVNGDGPIYIEGSGNGYLNLKTAQPLHVSGNNPGTLGLQLASTGGLFLDAGKLAIETYGDGPLAITTGYGPNGSIKLYYGLGLTLDQTYNPSQLQVFAGNGLEFASGGLLNGSLQVHAVAPLISGTVLSLSYNAAQLTIVGKSLSINTSDGIETTPFIGSGDGIRIRYGAGLVMLDSGSGTGTLTTTLTTTSAPITNTAGTVGLNYGAGLTVSGGGALITTGATIGTVTAPITNTSGSLGLLIGTLSGMAVNSTGALVNVTSAPLYIGGSSNGTLNLAFESPLGLNGSNQLVLGIESPPFYVDTGGNLGMVAGPGLQNYTNGALQGIAIALATNSGLQELPGLAIQLASPSGLSISGGPLEILAGAGITVDSAVNVNFDGTTINDSGAGGTLQVIAGDGLHEIDSTLAVNYGAGLQIVGGVLEAIGSSITAGDGLQEIGSTLSVNYGAGLQIVGGVLEATGSSITITGTGAMSGTSGTTVSLATDATLTQAGNTLSVVIANVISKTSITILGYANTGIGNQTFSVNINGGVSISVTVFTASATGWAIFVQCNSFGWVITAIGGYAGAVGVTAAGGQTLDGSQSFNPGGWSIGSFSWGN